MFYVKLDKNNKVERYPYTLTDLKNDHKHISFPTIIDECVIKEFAVYPVKTTEPPLVTYKENLIRSATKQKEGWIETWTIVNATEEEIDERKKQQIYSIKTTRNVLLGESDWTQTQDSPVDQRAWAAYRQALRDIPQQEGFPWDVTWPEKP